MSPRAPNILAATLAALVLFSAAPAASADVVFDGRWHTPGLNDWDGVLTLKAGNRNRLGYVTAPRRRTGGYAADLLVGGNAASERIEFLEANMIPDAEGTAQWWAWSFYIPSDSAIPSIAFVTQTNSKFNGIYCSVARGGASNGLRMMSPARGRPADRWYWTITGGRGSCRIKQIRIPGLRVVKDRWIDFLCHFRWSSSAAGRSNCSYRVHPQRAWRRAFDDAGPNLVSAPEEDGNLRVAQGLYKAEAPPYVHVVQGGLVVADTRTEAAQAAFGDPTLGAGSASDWIDRAKWALIAVALAVAAAVVLVLARGLRHGLRGGTGRLG
jgi:Polysaccharide lyase